MKEIDKYVRNLQLILVVGVLLAAILLFICLSI